MIRRRGFHPDFCLMVGDADRSPDAVQPVQRVFHLSGTVFTGHATYLQNSLIGVMVPVSVADAHPGGGCFMFAAASSAFAHLPDGFDNRPGEKRTQKNDYDYRHFSCNSVFLRAQAWPQAAQQPVHPDFLLFLMLLKASAPTPMIISSTTTSPMLTYHDPFQMLIRTGR